MKTKTYTLLIALLSISSICYSQEQFQTESDQSTVYSVFYNNLPEDFPYPVIGFFNRINGDYKGLELGFCNHATGTLKGVQYGLFNTTYQDLYGYQGGFLNSATNIYGLQDGFINNVKSTVYGVQNGFINSAQNVFGVQSGFINSAKQTTGVQFGFINSSEKVMGLQYGFINSAESLKGVQLGIINSVDDIENGLPIGFLSFVKHGGYKAIEIATNSIYPVNIAFKTGIRELYTYPMLSFDTRSANDQLAVGYGIGSNLDLSNKLFINPELEWLHEVSLDFNHFTMLKCNLGYSIGNQLELVAGPALIWHVKINAEDFHQNYTEFDPDILAVNKLKIGFNAAVRYKF